MRLIFIIHSVIVIKRDYRVKNQSKQYKNREEKEINTEILLGSITGLCPHRVSGYKSFI